MSYSELNSHTPTEEVKRDPALKALNAQLPAIRQAFELMKQSQEISEKVKMSMEALVPALEVQLYGLNSEIEQHVLNQEETEKNHIMENMMTKPSVIIYTEHVVRLPPVQLPHPRKSVPCHSQ